MNEAMPYRDGATTSNLFPKGMNGELDPFVLKIIGIDKKELWVVMLSFSTS